MKWLDAVWLIAFVALVVVVGCLMVGGCRTFTPGPAMGAMPPPPSRPTGLWLLVVVAGLCIAAGPAIGYFLKQVVAGVLVAVGGVSLLATVWMIERYPWVLWVSYAAAVVIGVYFAYDWYRGIEAKSENLAKTKTLAAIVPAIEAMGEGTQSAALKARIEANAGDALALVKAEVTAVKTEMGL